MIILDRLAGSSFVRVNFFSQQEKKYFSKIVEHLKKFKNKRQPIIVDLFIDYISRDTKYIHNNITRIIH